MKKLNLPIALLAALLTTGCDDSGSNNPASSRPASPSSLSMAVGNKTYTLEIAADELSRDLGLMNRDHMAADHGMIFVFSEAREQSFWMKNTLIPLDIVFLDAGGKVVSVHTMKPMDETSTPSDGPAKYAVELNAGETKTDGVKKGDSLTVPPAADTALKQSESNGPKP